MEKQNKESKKQKKGNRKKVIFKDKKKIEDQ
jgi:hypothetical protein